MLRPGQQAMNRDGSIHSDFYRWLAQLLQELRFGAIPPGAIIWAHLTTDQLTDYFDADGLGNAGSQFDGLQICNGNNGAPDWRDRFVRMSTSASGTTGGSDSSAHTHAIDHDHASFTSAAESGHTHAIDHDHASFSSGSTAITSAQMPAHTHSLGTVAEFIGGGAGDYDIASAGTDWQDRNNTGSTGTGDGHTHTVDVPALTGTSGASSGHTHAVDVPALTGTSGAASATDNKPAYITAVALMRVAA